MSADLICLLLAVSFILLFVALCLVGDELECVFDWLFLDRSPPAGPLTTAYLQRLWRAPTDGASARRFTAEGTLMRPVEPE